MANAVEISASAPFGARHQVRSNLNYGTSACVHARIGPGVAPVAAVLPELDIVPMRAAAVLEYTHQLMMAAVE